MIWHKGTDGTPSNSMTLFPDKGHDEGHRMCGGICHQLLLLREEELLPGDGQWGSGGVYTTVYTELATQKR